MYAHTNTKGSEIHDINYTESESWNREKLFTGRKQWAYDLTKPQPFFQFQWETFAAENFYGWFEFSFGNTFTSKKLLGESYFSTNTFLLQDFTFDALNVDLNFPYRAFVAFGSDYWSCQIGRDRLNWGNGQTGNLTISDNLPFHNMARFTIFSDKYKNTFLLSLFPHAGNYYYDDNSDGIKTYHFTNSLNSSLSGIELYIAHRFEGCFLKDRLNATITEAIVYSSEDDHIEFSTLNPAGFYHNAYIPGNANSTLAFEFDWTVFSGWNIYSQFLIDEMQLFGEDTAWPSAFGFMLGSNWARPFAKGLLTFNAESVYTSAYTYLRYGQYPNEQSQYGIDYIVAHRLFSNSCESRAVYEEYCLGYKYGPDVITGSLSLDWKRKKLEAGARYFFMADGCHDFWTKWTKKDTVAASQADDNYTTPTSEHEGSGNYRYDVSDRNAVSYTNIAGISCKYQFLKNLKIFAEADFVFVKNAWNKSSNGLEFDFQFTSGIRWNCF